MVHKARAAALGCMALAQWAGASLAQCPGTWSAAPLSSPVSISQVGAVVELPGGDWIVGGRRVAPTSIGGGPIARYRPSTATWTALGSGIPTSGTVNALLVLPGGDVLVGGRFLTAGGVVASAIARYSPATNTWSALAGGGVDDGDVYALALLPDGTVIVGGTFLTAGSPSTGLPVDAIARYDLTTAAWLPLGTRTTPQINGVTLPSNITGLVNAVAVVPAGAPNAGDVIVAGSFASANGVAAANIARWRPSTQAWSSVGNAGSGPGGTVYGVGLLPGGDVVAAGEFAMAGTATANNFARFRQSTGTWTGIGVTPNIGLNGVAWALTVLPSGDVVGGGLFQAAGGVNANRIARLNPTTSVWTPLGAGGFNNAGGVDFGGQGVLCIRPLSSGELAVGGGFGSVGASIPSFGLARYAFGPTCRADFDCSGTRTIDDIFLFVNAWFVGCLGQPGPPCNGRSVDIDGNNTRGIDDIFLFLNLWFAGCA